MSHDYLTWANSGNDIPSSNPGAVGILADIVCDVNWLRRPWILAFQPEAVRENQHLGVPSSVPTLAVIIEAEPTHILWRVCANMH